MVGATSCSASHWTSVKPAPTPVALVKRTKATATPDAVVFQTPTSRRRKPWLATAKTDATARTVVPTTVERPATDALIFYPPELIVSVQVNWIESPFETLTAANTR